MPNRLRAGKKNQSPASPGSPDPPALLGRPDQFVDQPPEEYARLFPWMNTIMNQDKAAREKTRTGFSGSARLNPGETFPLERRNSSGAYRIECSTTDHKGAMVETAPRSSCPIHSRAGLLIPIVDRFDSGPC